MNPNYSYLPLDRWSRNHNVEPVVSLAVAAVESSGRAFGPDGLPVVRYEPHVAWRAFKRLDVNPSLIDLPIDLLSRSYRAARARTQAEEWQRIHTVSRHSDLRLYNQVAIEATSWGMFQVLGENWKELGYVSAWTFRRSMNSLEGQIYAYERFLSHKKLWPFLRGLRYEDFAAVYNGPRNKILYGRKLRQAVAAFRKLPLPVYAGNWNDPDPDRIA